MSLPGFVITCEHGGNQIPVRYRRYFANAGVALASHRGFDPGALVLARKFSKRIGVPLHFAVVSRLLIELNRSLGHPSLFSEFARALDNGAREELLNRYYHPYRNNVESACVKTIARHNVCFHLSVHSFTPVLNGVVRNADIGLLYDPSRPFESQFARHWQQQIRMARPDLNVRLNYPYRGKSDGLTTYLRRKLGNRYLGIELEVNQRWPQGNPKKWKDIESSLIETLAIAIPSEFPVE